MSIKHRRQLIYDTTPSYSDITFDFQLTTTTVQLSHVYLTVFFCSLLQEASGRGGVSLQQRGHGGRSLLQPTVPEPLCSVSGGPALLLQTPVGPWRLVPRLLPGNLAGPPALHPRSLSVSQGGGHPATRGRGGGEGGGSGGQGKSGRRKGYVSVFFTFGFI